MSVEAAATVAGEVNALLALLLRTCCHNDMTAFLGKLLGANKANPYAAKLVKTFSTLRRSTVLESKVSIVSNIVCIVCTQSATPAFAPVTRKVFPF